MDFAYLHIITNHIPIIGMPIATVLLLFGLWRRSDELKTFGLLLLIAMGVAALVTYLFGNAGEDFVEKLAGITENAIHEHEDFAKIALASVIFTAVVSSFALVYPFVRLAIGKQRSTEKPLLNGVEFTGHKNHLPTFLILPVIILAMICSSLLGYTGKLGGKIRHTEFYAGSASANDQNEDELDTDNDSDEKGGKRRRGKD